ncbi:MAG: glutathionylspermidine synthase family protein [Lachnospiraceae bacterium]|nr:glutathionylspermidine synthase family protein [Lachnospiraceae bacterium]
MRLVPIPTSEYEEYRLNLMFDCYKWDPQFYDNNTVAKYALVITEEEHKHISSLTESLDKETRAAEQFLNNHQELVAPLKLTRQLRGDIGRMCNYNPDQHIRLTRYDFHPVSDVEGGWAISEVNSDVPGGFAEASLMPRAAIECLNRAQDIEQIMEKPSYHFVNYGDVMVEEVKKKVKVGGRIMLVHCTCYSDDRQVMQYLGDRLVSEGYQVIYGAVEHVSFKDNKAYCVLDGNEGELDAIFRFTPLEWFKDIKPKRWQGYFDTETVSCNHPVAIYAQTRDSRLYGIL